MPNGDFKRMLLERRHELDVRFAKVRRDHQRQRDALDLLLAAEGHEEGDKPAVESIDVIYGDPGQTANDLPPTRSFIRRALTEAGGPMQMVDVVVRVQELGSTASPDTVRGVLQKMLRSEEVARIGRGLYRLTPKAKRLETPETLERMADASDLFELQQNSDSAHSYLVEGTLDTTN